MDINSNKPLILKGLLWGAFSGTATVAAFLLPAFILGQMLYGRNYSSGLPPWLLWGIVIVTILCAAYHSVYRVIASNHDLKLVGQLLRYILLILLITLLVALFAPT